MATILVIDDDRLIRDLLLAALRRHGHEVLTASSGREGLDLFRKRRPDCVLLDLYMPEMDGIEVLRRIRAMEAEASVIILTGRATDALEAQAWKLGATDFLSKGLSVNRVVEAVERGMGRPPVPAIEKLLDTREKGSILVVDDDPQVSEVLKEFLTLRGYRVRSASNGREALALLNQERPKLILLDLYMPVMNGVEVMRELRASKYEGGVIVLTGSQDEKLLKEAADLGAVDVMGKPVSLERLELVMQLGCILTQLPSLESLGPDFSPQKD
jgi:CheY-like chemotaxis protein